MMRHRGVRDTEEALLFFAKEEKQSNRCTTSLTRSIAATPVLIKMRSCVPYISTLNERFDSFTT